MNYEITCKACGSKWTADDYDNCAKCGSPDIQVTRRSDYYTPSCTVVSPAQADGPMTITRIQDYDYLYGVTKFRASKLIGGQRYAAVISVCDSMIQSIERDELMAYIERTFREKMARTIADEMVVHYGERALW